MSTIDLLGSPHAYDLTAPTGCPDVLVFVHGWLLSRTYWQPLIELLSPQYQCLAYDLRGFGESQPLPSRTIGPLEASYSLESYANDLAILLKQLDISSAWLVGHSFGGSVALWGAKRLPEQVRGVICLNAGGGIYLKEEFERFRAVGQQLIKWRPRWLRYLPLLELPFTRANVVKPIDRRWARQRLVDFVTADAAAALGALLDSTTEAEVHRLPQLVSRLSQPVYFIAGAQDTIMEPKYVRHLASFHPLFEGDGANVTELTSCGHLAMIEQPTLVAETVRTIVTSSGQQGDFKPQSILK